MNRNGRNFHDTWMEAAEIKNSVLCAGLDPAPFEMGRGDSGLPEGVSKRDWALAYVRAVAPWCAAVKPNSQYWKAPGDAEVLAEIRHLAREHHLAVIEDCKLADIGTTNDACMFYAGERADAITFSPFAGNGREACEAAHARGLGIIIMCLMSNPEYRLEKDKLVPAAEPKLYRERDILSLGETAYVPQFIHLARSAGDWGADGAVIGAPSAGNHITAGDIETAAHYLAEKCLILCPGVGAQGGEAPALFRVFGGRRVILNLGRMLMFPKGSASTPEDQAEAAKQAAAVFNGLRAGK